MPFRTLGLTFCLFVVLVAGVIRVYRVDGQSMAPTLSDGQIVLVSRISATARAGDVVVFRSPIGDTLAIKRIYRDMGTHGMLLLGDNRDLSLDSRHFGLVPEDRLRGRVIYVGR